MVHTTYYISVALVVRFVDFANRPDPKIGLLAGLLKQISFGEIRFSSDPKEKVDLEIASNFIHKSWPVKAFERTTLIRSHERRLDYEANYDWGYRRHYKSKSSKRIWWTGENLRPPIQMFDATYTCNLDDTAIENYFFPYWFYRLNWGFGDNGFEYQPNPSELLENRQEEKRNRNACSFSSSIEPHRKFVNYAVGGLMSLDEYGFSANKPVESKAQFASRYGFQVCTENDIYPNYVTEKVIEAWVSGNIPIWSGCDELQFLNKNAIIDVTGLTSNEISEKISGVSDEQAAYMRSLPILNRMPSLANISASLESLINKS